MVSLIINQIIKMLLILLLGCLCYRCRLIDESGSKTLANLLLMVVNPLVAIMALQIDYRPELVSGLLASYLLAVVTHLLAILLAQLLIHKPGGKLPAGPALPGAASLLRGSEDYAIERFSCIYSNCGFIGIPLVQSALGNEGVFYLTAYITVFNIFSWTHGISMITGRTSLKELKKGLLTPMIAACILGLILFFAQIRIPGVPADAINYVAGMNTPLAMLIAGISVAQTDLRKMLKNLRIYLIAALKLLLMPAATLLLLVIFPINYHAALAILIAAACPTGATGTAFALKFHKNHRYASELYAFTTLLSLLTIPAFIFAAESLLSR